MHISTPKARRVGANLRRNRAKAVPTPDHVEEPKHEEPKHEEPKPEVQQPVQQKRRSYITKLRDVAGSAYKQWIDAKHKNQKDSDGWDKKKKEHNAQIKANNRNVFGGIGKMLTSPIRAVFTKEELEMKNFIQRFLQEHSEVMNTSEDGSPDLLPLVHAAMNGDPATTQSMFADAMKEKMAAAIDAYKQVAMQNVFNEPSEMDADDYEDGEEALAEDFGPEDEDEFEEEEPDDEDLEFDDEVYDGSDDDESEDEV